MITARIEGDEAVVAVFKELGPEFTRVAKKALLSAGEDVRASSVEDFFRTQGESYEHTFKSGKRKGLSVTRYKALGAPIEGMLTSRHGGHGLLGSIFVADTGSLTVAIGTPLVYGPIHEFGNPARHMPMRPYLRPALAKQWPIVQAKIREALANAVAKVIQRTGAMRVKP